MYCSRTARWFESLSEIPWKLTIFYILVIVTHKYICYQSCNGIVLFLFWLQVGSRIIMMTRFVIQSNSTKNWSSLFVYLEISWIYGKTNVSLYIRHTCFDLNKRLFRLNTIMSLLIPHPIITLHKQQFLQNCPASGYKKCLSLGSFLLHSAICSVINAIYNTSGRVFS